MIRDMYGEIRVDRYVILCVYVYIGDLSGLGFRPPEYLIVYIPIWGGSKAISPKP